MIDFISFKHFLIQRELYSKSNLMLISIVVIRVVDWIIQNNVHSNRLIDRATEMRELYVQQSKKTNSRSRVR